MRRWKNKRNCKRVRESKHKTTHTISMVWIYDIFFILFYFFLPKKRKKKRETIKNSWLDYRHGSSINRCAPSSKWKPKWKINKKIKKKKDPHWNWKFVCTFIFHFPIWTRTKIIKLKSTWFLIKQFHQWMIGVFKCLHVLANIQFHIDIPHFFQYINKFICHRTQHHIKARNVSVHAGTW